jgi:hypothetical protein
LLPLTPLLLVLLPLLLLLVLVLLVVAAVDPESLLPPQPVRPNGSTSAVLSIHVQSRFFMLNPFVISRMAVALATGLIPHRSDEWCWRRLRKGRKASVNTLQNNGGQRGDPNAIFKLSVHAVGISHLSRGGRSDIR